MLKLHDVRAGYGRIEILKGISLEISAGEIIALLGPNGAGKTTTLKTICGLLQPTGGNIIFNDREISKLTADAIVGLGVSMVPEGRRIFPNLSVMENIKIGAFSRWKETSFKSELENVLSMFPALKNRLKESGGALSGGEQQMLAIARALMSRPKLLLLDEPSMGLAPILVDSVFQYIEQLNAKGTTVLLVEQNVSLALKYVDRGYVLETGKIVASGTAEQLLQDKKLVIAYLGDQV